MSNDCRRYAVLGRAPAETNSILIRRQMRIPHRHDQARMAQDLLQRQDVPAVLDEVAAEECRSAWAACPLGSRIVVLASARRNEVIECMNGLCSLQCFTIRFSSSAEIGTDRTFRFLSR